MGCATRTGPRTSVRHGIIGKYWVDKVSTTLQLLWESLGRSKEPFENFLRQETTFWIDLTELWSEICAALRLPLVLLNYFSANPLLRVSCDTDNRRLIHVFAGCRVVYEFASPASAGVDVITAASYHPWTFHFQGFRMIANYFHGY